MSYFPPPARLFRQVNTYIEEQFVSLLATQNFIAAYAATFGTRFLPTTYFDTDALQRIIDLHPGILSNDRAIEVLSEFEDFSNMNDINDKKSMMKNALEQYLNQYHNNRNVNGGKRRRRRRNAAKSKTKKSGSKRKRAKSRARTKSKK